MQRAFIVPTSEVDQYECIYRLFYLLRDLGIMAASDPAREAWFTYMSLVQLNIIVVS